MSFYSKVGGISDSEKASWSLIGKDKYLAVMSGLRTPVELAWGYQMRMEGRRMLLGGPVTIWIPFSM